jgi:hypothetical protein
VSVNDVGFESEAKSLQRNERTQKRERISVVQDQSLHDNPVTLQQRCVVPACTDEGDIVSALGLSARQVHGHMNIAVSVIAVINNMKDTHFSTRDPRRRAVQDPIAPQLLWRRP